MSSGVGFLERFLRLSGADIWRTLNIERPTLNIEIRGRVDRKGAKGRRVFWIERNVRGELEQNSTECRLDGNSR